MSTVATDYRWGPDGPPVVADAEFGAVGRHTGLVSGVSERIGSTSPRKHCPEEEGSGGFQLTREFLDEQSRIHHAAAMSDFRDGMKSYNRHFAEKLELLEAEVQNTQDDTRDGNQRAVSLSDITQVAGGNLNKVSATNVIQQQKKADDEKLHARVRMIAERRDDLQYKRAFFRQLSL